MIPETNKRNVFVEGSLETYAVAKQLIESIIEEHLKLQLQFKNQIMDTSSEQMICGKSQTSNINEMGSNTYVGSTAACTFGDLTQYDASYIESSKLTLVEIARVFTRSEKSK